MYLKLIFVAALLNTFIDSSEGDFYHPECSQAGLTCLDCYTQKLCVNLIVSMVHWSNSTCLSDLTNNQYPYCDPTTEQCSSIAPEGCAEKIGFVCPRERGIFPDVGNCSRYFKCENNTVNIVSCASTHIYSQQFGKCVIKLSNVDCKGISCGLSDYTNVYPGDATLYYQCKSGVPKLKACAQNMIYNVTTNSCEAICKSTNAVAVQQNCSSYYSCSLVNEKNYTTQLQTCAKGYGFNPNFNRCELGFNNLCNELALLEIDTLQLLQLLPNFIRDLLLNVYTLLFKWSFVVSLLEMLGISEDTISSSIVVINYVVTYKTIPPTFITYLSNILLTSSSKELKAIVEIILKLFMKISQPSGEVPEIFTFSLKEETPQSLENLLNNVIKIDFDHLISIVQSGNELELIHNLLGQIMKFFNLTPSQLSTVLQSLQYQVNFVVDYVNSALGFKIFNVDPNGNVRLNYEVIENVFMNNQEGLKMLQTINNPLLSQVIETVQMRNVNYDSLRKFIENFYFSFQALSNYVSTIIT